MAKQVENYITSSITQENKIIELANCYMCHVFAVSVYQFHCTYRVLSIFAFYSFHVIILKSDDYW